jgi:hypothetical protein
MVANYFLTKKNFKAIRQSSSFVIDILASINGFELLLHVDGLNQISGIAK